MYFNKTRLQKGQSLIEFILCFLLITFTLLLFIKVAINSGAGYLAHYATFMAARSYAVYQNPDDPSNEEDLEDGPAKELAETVFKSYGLDKYLPGNGALSLKINAPNSTVNADHRDIFVGAYLDFEQPFSMSMMMGGTAPVKLRTEAFLLREPTRQGCLTNICKAIGMFYNIGQCGSASPSAYSNITLEDNGC